MKSKNSLKSIGKAEEQVNFKDHIFSLLQNYGDIETTRGFDIEVRGKNRKYLTLSSADTRIDLVDAFAEIV